MPMHLEWSNHMAGSGCGDVACWLGQLLVVQMLTGGLSRWLGLLRT